MTFHEVSEAVAGDIGTIQSPVTGGLARGWILHIFLVLCEPLKHILIL